MAISDYKTALVTGASSGIGAAVATRLCDEELEVHVIGRSDDRLAELAAETGCTPHHLDLRDTERVYDLVGHLEIDLLINNAGIGRGFQGFFTATPEDIDATVDTNVKAMLHVLRAALPGMMKRKRGHVVNLGSVSGLYPIASTIYSASKGAVHMLSQNLRIELEGTGVRVTEICPGRVSTAFLDSAVDDVEARERIKQTGIRELTTDDIADAVMYAVEAPAHVNVNLIDIQPLEQIIGGSHFAPVDWPEPVPVQGQQNRSSRA
jgi:NADP-dependent 3-hydroxy acid dehydrogenase YdfG